MRVSFPIAWPSPINPNRRRRGHRAARPAVFARRRARRRRECLLETLREFRL